MKASTHKKKNKTINVPLTEEVYYEIKSASDFFGCSMSFILRKCIDDSYVRVTRRMKEDE